MTHASAPLNRYVLAALAAMCVGVAACHEESTAPTNHPTPGMQLNNLGTVIVDVDVQRGLVTVRPASASATLPPGVSGRFFGNPNQIRHVLTPTLATPIGATGAEYHLQERINNLLTWAIGTNSPHTVPNFPQDTMGVYVYYAFLPYNFKNLSGNCLPPTCTVAVDSADGSYPFTTSSPQPYVYFKTILEGGGLSAPNSGRSFTNQTVGVPGGIDYFRTLNFVTTGSVTNFSFGLSVVAAWVDPNEATWKVTYLGDSLPTRNTLQTLQSEPDWRRLGHTGATTITPAACVPNTGACNLTLVATAGDTVVYYRSDSLRAGQPGYIAATLSLSTLTGTQPGVFLGLKDPAKLAQLGISTALTGFTDSLGTLLPLYSFPTVLGRTTYRVAKYGTDSASIFSPASSTVALMTIPYSALPAAPIRGIGPQVYDRFFFFGNVTASVTATAATSLWSNVNYEIGEAKP